MGLMCGQRLGQSMINTNSWDCFPNIIRQVFGHIQAEALCWSLYLMSKHKQNCRGSLFLMSGRGCNTPSYFMNVLAGSDSEIFKQYKLDKNLKSDSYLIHHLRIRKLGKLGKLFLASHAISHQPRPNSEALQGQEFENLENFSLASYAIFHQHTDRPNTDAQHSTGSHFLTSAPALCPTSPLSHRNHGQV